MTTSSENTKGRSASSGKGDGPRGDGPRGDGLDRSFQIPGFGSGFQGLDLSNMPNPMLGMAQMQAMALRMYLSRQQEVLEFMSKRCSQDLEMIDKIMAAKEAGAVTGVVADFYRDAARDYSEAVTRSVSSAPRAAAAASEATLGMVRSFTEPMTQSPPA